MKINPGFSWGSRGGGSSQSGLIPGGGPFKSQSQGHFYQLDLLWGQRYGKTKSKMPFCMSTTGEMRVIPFRTSTTRKRVLGYGSNSCLKGSHLKANSHHKEVPSLFGGDEAQSSFLKSTGSRGHPHEWTLGFMRRMFVFCRQFQRGAVPRAIGECDGRETGEGGGSVVDMGRRWVCVFFGYVFAVFITTMLGVPETRRNKKASGLMQLAKRGTFGRHGKGFVVV